MSGKVPRETIMTALLARLAAACGATFKNYSREFIMFEDMVQLIGSNSPNMPEFPCLFLYDGGLKSDVWRAGGRGSPDVRTMYRHIIIYARKTGGGTPGGPDRTPGGTILHPLIESVEAAFDPKTPPATQNIVDNELTLGNLVWQCHIDGEGSMIPGDIDVTTGLCMQTIPVVIITP